jgi:hypothetical protein
MCVGCEFISVLTKNNPHTFYIAFLKGLGVEGLENGADLELCISKGCLEQITFNSLPLVIGGSR